MFVFSMLFVLVVVLLVMLFRTFITFSVSLGVFCFSLVSFGCIFSSGHVFASFTFTLFIVLVLGSLRGFKKFVGCNLNNLGSSSASVFQTFVFNNWGFRGCFNFFSLFNLLIFWLVFRLLFLVLGFMIRLLFTWLFSLVFRLVLIVMLFSVLSVRSNQLTVSLNVIISHSSRRFITCVVVQRFCGSLFFSRCCFWGGIRSSFSSDLQN